MFDRDTFDDKHKAPPPAPADELFGPAFEADGEPTTTQRQRPSGRFVDRDTSRTDFGVDRGGSGQFVSRDRELVPTVRQPDGEVELDKFAVGNFDAFGDSP